MKTALLLCALSVCFAAVGQTTPVPLPVAETGGRVVYSLVIDSPGATQSVLYGKALRWLAGLPQIGPPSLVQDAAGGLVAGRVGAAFVSRAGFGTMPCTMWRQVSVQVKDGRAKYEARDFAVQYYVASPAALTPPTKLQAELHPFEEYTEPTNGRYYTKDGQPRTWTASLLNAAGEQTAGEVATLRRALTTDTAW